MRNTDPQIVYSLYRMVFNLSQRFQYLTDDILRKDNLTAKQFHLSAIIDQSFADPPSVKEVANIMDTSHQNVKAIANQLQRKGFLQIEKDPDDRRRQLLKLTEKSRQYWDSQAKVGEDFMLSLFDALSDEELVALSTMYTKLLMGTEDQYRSSKNH